MGTSAHKWVRSTSGGDTRPTGHYAALPDFRGSRNWSPLLVAVLPVEQRLVHPGRLDRADPLGIVDQQLTVERGSCR